VSFSTGDTLGILGSALAIATTAIWFRKIRAVDIPEARAPYVAAFVVAAILGVAALAVGVGVLGGVGAVLAVVLGGMMAGLRAISAQDAKVPAVRIGEPMLEFSAPDENGDLFESARLRGRPFLLKFFRGHW